MSIDKKTLLCERDGKGELIPQSIFIDKIGGEVSLTPLSRGEFLSYLEKIKSNPKEAEAEIIVIHCKTPVLTKEDVNEMKAGFAQELINKIMDISGMGANPIPINSSSGSAKT